MYDAERVKDDFRCKFISDRLLEEKAALDDAGDDDNKGKTKQAKFVPLEKFATVLLDHTYTVWRIFLPMFALLYLTLSNLQTTEYSRKWMEEHPTARMPDARFLD